MKDKIVIITGASDGIGAVAAKDLSKRGATVVVVGRSPEKTKKIAESITAPYYIADFSKLSDVRELAASIRKDYSHIDILINNAGGIFGDREVTEDGFEKTLQVNHLAPFLLTNLLLDILTASNARVLNTSSVANKILSKFDINDLNAVKHYSARTAYGNSKLANILFTKELDRRYSGSGITTAAFHPGNVATNFASGAKGIFKFLYHGPFKKLFGLITPEQGADNMIWLATSEPNADWASGQYYVKHSVGKTATSAHDSELAQLLWEKSAEMTLQ